jgi:hypothetical protein
MGLSTLLRGTIEFKSTHVLVCVDDISITRRALSGATEMFNEFAVATREMGA